MDDLNGKLYYFEKRNSWEEATEFCDHLCRGGYEAEHILNAVIESTNKVIYGDALYEQDGIAYYKEHHNYELLFALMYVYSREKNLNVLDYGGSLGSTFHRYKNILPDNTKWSVVEQEKYVSYGKDIIKDIGFYYTFEECLNQQDINVVLFSGSVQYFPNPFKVIEKVANKVKFVLLDETPFGNGNKSEGIYIQHVPDAFYGVETYYPVHVFSREEIINFLTDNRFDILFEWRYEGIGTGIQIKDDNALIDTIDRGFLIENRLLEKKGELE